MMNVKCLMYKYFVIIFTDGESLLTCHKVEYIYSLTGCYIHQTWHGTVKSDSAFNSSKFSIQASRA